MSTNDEDIKGFFTAYLNVALKREREDYINGKSKEEIPIDMETVDAEKQVEFEQNYEAMILEKLKEFSGTRKDSGKNLLDGYGEELEKAVSYLEESEKMVILLKGYLELTYKEIGTIMGMSDRKGASIYHYARKNYKGGWRKNMGFEELLMEAKAGSKAAKEELYNMYRPRLIHKAVINGKFDEDSGKTPVRTLSARIYVDLKIFQVMLIYLQMIWLFFKV